MEQRRIMQQLDQRIEILRKKWGTSVGESLIKTRKETYND